MLERWLRRHSETLAQPSLYGSIGPASVSRISACLGITACNGRYPPVSATA